MGFVQAVGAYFAQYSNFKGRASRSEYWWVALFLFVLIAAVVAIDGALGLNFKTIADDGERFNAGFGRLTSITVLLTVLPSLALTGRRLHDRNKSGWWFLLTLVPLVGPIVLIVWYLLPGTIGYNRYGFDPRDRLSGVPQAWNRLTRTIALRAAEFLFVLQVWFIALLHRFEAAVAPVEFARTGSRWFEWSGRALDYLDQAIVLFKTIDAHTYYALLDGVFGIVGLRMRHASEDWILIVLGTLYIAWTNGHKVYGAFAKMQAAKTKYTQVKVEYDNGTPIVPGAVIGAILAGPIGAAAGALWGAVVKSGQHDEVEAAAVEVGGAFETLRAVALGCALAIGYDLAVNYGFQLVHVLST